VLLGLRVAGVIGGWREAGGVEALFHFAEAGLE
jgi:hypothetical protein